MEVEKGKGKPREGVNKKDPKAPTPPPQLTPLGEKKYLVSVEKYIDSVYTYIVSQS